MSTLAPVADANRPGDYPGPSLFWGKQNEISYVINPFSSKAYTDSNFFQYLPSRECL
jgi:hypothetical protein